MDKLTLSKAIDTLKNTECSAKEKIQKFEIIYETLSSLTLSSNYKNYLQSSIQVLLLFCEDNDYNVRQSAEENLNRIIRMVERQHQIVFIQIELYHEIKKNGNERSLRICLNLFSHYAQNIKHRRKKVYAQNLVPCLLAIGKRREPLVIETFLEFMKSFSKYLLNCLSEYEVMKLVDLFMENVGAECAIKRRCSSQNLSTMVEHLNKKKVVLKSLISKIQENLAKEQQLDLQLGTLGLLRLLSSTLIESKEYHPKVVELIEVCLNFLKSESNHSVINANLEVINEMLSSSVSKREMKNLLIDSEKHKEILLSRHPAVYGSRKSSDDTLKNQDHHLQVPFASTSLLSTPNRSLGDFSDIEGDSFKSGDFEQDIASSSPATFRNVIGTAETMSLKSADSINSFFSSILTHNTDSVTKFFKKSTDSPTHQVKVESDDKSLDITLLNDDIIDCTDSQALPETAEMAMEDSITQDDTIEIVDTSSESQKEIYIGTIYDQSIVEYVVRLVSSKFLLDGTPKALISDQTVRVSIKNLALSCVALCVELKWEVLLIKLSKDFTSESMMVESLLSFLVDEDLRLEKEEKKKKTLLDQQGETSSNQAESFLEIKDDHFGECTTATFLDYFSPLSQTIDDQGLISLKNRIYEEKTKDREASVKKINQDLCKLLTSKSEISEKLPLMETSLKMPEDKDSQFVADILLFSSHGDPVLRANVYAVIGNFIKCILDKNLDYDKVLSRHEFIKDVLTLSGLIDHLLEGLKDEIHSVVKQTLTAWEKCINLLIPVIDNENIIKIMNGILMVSNNKYWLVQMKYCDVIINIDLNTLENQNHAEIYKKQIFEQIFGMIKDSDFRVRNYASEALAKYITFLSQTSKSLKTSSLMSFYEKNIIQNVAFMDLTHEANQKVEIELSKILHTLTNSLMELKEKNHQFGVIYALKVLIRNFSPSRYAKVFKEFNINQILASFINRNSSIGLDVSCHCDMLEIIKALVASNDEIKENNELLIHLLKILNIFSHLINNSKPLVAAKGKTDIFTSSKELTIINRFGFFTGDHFYLKFYLILKNSFDSYRMTINQDAETKLKNLLRLTFESLQILLELKSACKEDVKLVEEIVGYLNQIISFQPNDCILTAKILLKFVFRKNYTWTRFELEKVHKAAKDGNNSVVFDYLSKSSASDFIFEDSLIKTFDNIVIQSLRLFSKSPANLQRDTLDLLCQLLDFNVNYMQLDAKKVFVDFVLKQLEYIEDGLVIDGEILSPKIVEFLFHLSKLKDKKLSTTPKIINLIDVQLAATTKLAKECGVQALLAFSKEIFFKPQPLPQSSEAEVVEAHTKDLNALKEVTISMMLKFIHHSDVQQFLEWIFLKNKSIVDENELYQLLIGNLKNESCELLIIKSVSKNIILNSKNFKSILEIYWKLIDKNDLRHAEKLIFIQKNILNIAEEVYFVNHIKLVHQKQNLGGNALEKFLESHYKYLIMLLSEKQSCGDFLNFIKFENFSSLAEKMRKIVIIKEVIEHSSAISTDHVMEYLLAIEKSLEEIEANISTSYEEKSVNRQLLLNSLYKIIFDQKSDLSAWETNEIMSFFKTASKAKILLKFSHNQLIKSLMEDVEISRIIIRKISKVKLPLKKIKFILENAHNGCLLDVVLFLISIESSDDVKILQLVLVKKLHSLRDKITFGELLKLKEKLFEFEVQQKFIPLLNAIKVLQKSENSNIIVDYNEMNKVIDENWLILQAEQAVSDSSVQVAEMLYEIKSESKLTTLLSSEKFNVKLLSATINTSFERMLKSFRIDCISINPHLNYMKVSPLLKTSINSLINELNSEKCDIIEISKIVKVLMQWINELYHVALIYVDVKLIERFIADNFLRNLQNCLEIFMRKIFTNLFDMKNLSHIELMLEVIYSILLAVPEITEDYDDFIFWMSGILKEFFALSDLIERYQNPPIFDEINDDNLEVIKEAIFIGKVVEFYEDGDLQFIPISAKQKKVTELCFKLSQLILRKNKFYQFIITPYEIMTSYRFGDNMLDPQTHKLKQIPIEYLSDSDLLERFIRRINRYGFTQRKEFEEIFMTLLVLLNQWNEMQDVEEQFCIKQLCLQMNVDLLISCFRHQNFNNPNYCNYSHLPRSERWARMDLIGVKKLHHIQEVLDSKLNVFYQSNLERIDIAAGSNAISTKSFGMNQFSLSYTWHMTNEVTKKDHVIRNMTYVHAEKLEIDYKSALQLVYDLMTQTIDENPVLVLPQLAKLIEVLDNIEQFKWINKKMLTLYEVICTEDTISHQHIVYLLCRSSAVLVPTLSDLQQIVPILNKYLGCNHMFVRNATLEGLLCLFESLIKANTTMGGVSDELKLLRSTIANYVNKNGIVFESTSTSSTPQHDKLVWTLNFYVLESTIKFGDCNELLIDTIISGNNILKRTNDIDLFYLIINGLERLAIIDHENRLYREKIEKLSLDLIKIDNKSYSLGGLKLLVTCMYMGSLDQLESTEKSNGIVQDEPEIVMQSIEKIEILFSRIRGATADEAEVYGRVLAQVLKDLLPPNEILTKIIKELLILNQSNILVISKIVHQVFRSAIDSSYLALLQEWLICSLPNFLTYPNESKSIWFLTLIFMSSTINLNILKLFPLILDEEIADAQLYWYFIISAKDFYTRLSEKQRLAFRDCFKSKSLKSSDLFQNLLKHL